MMKKVCKLFMAWQFEEEEQWLNQMSRQGWQLEKTNGLLYTFQQGGMDKYQYRVQMVDSLSKSGDYLQFLSEAGIEHVGTCFNGLWIYLRKQNNGEPFELFSDTTSQLHHLQKIKKQLDICKALFCVVYLLECILSLFDPHRINALCLLVFLPFLMAICHGLGTLSEKIKTLEKEKLIHD